MNCKNYDIADYFVRTLEQFYLLKLKGSMQEAGKSVFLDFAPVIIF